MKKVFTALSMLVSLVGVLLVAAPGVAAYQFQCGSSQPVETSIDLSSYATKYCKSADSHPLSALTLVVIDFMSVGVGIAVVIGIAWGGLVYAQAGGDSGKTKEAISIITNAIIGLLLFIGLYALANFFIPGGLFT